VTQSIVIFILIAVFQAVAGYYAKKAKEKQAAAEAAGRGEGSGVGAAPSLDGTRPVQVNSVRPMNAEQAIAVARLIEQRNVVEAVMALRAICNIGLAEARDVVQQFPVRGFPAELVPTAAAAANEARRQADARLSAAAPPPVIDRDDPEAASQEGDDEESNDAKHSLASVRAAIEQVRVEAKTVFDQALHAAGLQRAPEPERTPAPAASAGVAAAAQAHRVEPAATFPGPAPAAPVAVAPSRRQRGATANAVVGLLRTKEGARQALLVSEILGPPRAVKPLR
jgi:hypothetical protein